MNYKEYLNESVEDEKKKALSALSKMKPLTKIISNAIKTITDPHEDGTIPLDSKIQRDVFAMEKTVESITDILKRK